MIDIFTNSIDRGSNHFINQNGYCKTVLPCSSQEYEYIDRLDGREVELRQENGKTMRIKIVVNRSETIQRGEGFYEVVYYTHLIPSDN